MTDLWERELSCATQCSRCHRELDKADDRILSAYDHHSICMECKHAEENRSDYKEVFREMIGQCMAETETMWGDPGAYCYHHFYPYTCIEPSSKNSDSIHKKWRIHRSDGTEGVFCSE